MPSAITPHTIQVRRTARYYTLGPTHGFPRELWVVVHGYGQLARRFIEWFKPLDDGSRLVLAPEALSRFYLDPIAERRTQAEPRVGATWMTREDRLTEIEDYVRYLDRVHDAVRGGAPGAARVVAFGYSQGAATASRWAALGEAQPDALILWCGLLPPDLDPGAPARWAARGLAVTLVVGRGDAFTPPDRVAEQERRLREAGVACRVVWFDGGHELHAETLRAVAAGRG